MKALATFTLSTNYRKVNERLVRYPKKSSATFVCRERLMVSNCQLLEKRDKRFDAARHL
jgi:hypothetical protein